MGIMQFDPTTIEGSVWFIVIISVLAAVGIAILKFLISSVVEFFVVKKRENEDEIKTEVSKISILIFILLSAIILFWQKDSIAHVLNRPEEELLFVAFMLFLLVVLVAGVIYREPSKKVRAKFSRNKD